jgi:DNA-binding CsgD family transcriptional regulator
VVTDSGCAALLEAARTLLQLLGGDARASAALVPSPPATTASGSAPFITAVAALGSAIRGRPDEALELSAAGWQALEAASAPTERLFAELLLAQAEVFALFLAERVHVLDRRSAELVQRMLTDRPWPGDPIAACHRGCAALAAGRLPDAVRWFLEAELGLRDRDPLGLRTMASSLLVMATALAGDPTRARAQLAENEQKSRGVRCFEPLIGLAEACVAVVEGRPADATGPALEASALAAAQGQPALQALILSRMLRLGVPVDVEPTLTHLAADLDAPLVTHLAMHATAVAAGDASRLAELSVGFERAGALALAADMAAGASTAYEGAGAKRAAADARVRAATLYRSCGLSAAPTLERLALPSLTAREREVAVLANQGLTNQAIADRLVLSVRTVEAHLSHVYTKSGITSRAGLVAALAVDGASTATGS